MELFITLATIIASVVGSAVGLGFYFGRKQGQFAAVKTEVKRQGHLLDDSIEKNEKSHAWLFKASNRILGHLGIEVD